MPRIPDQYQTIVEHLLVASRAGRVAWNEVTGKKAVGQFSVSFARFAVLLWAGEEEGGSYVAFAIRDAKGELVDSFWIDSGSADFNKLSELHERARRSARRIDLAIAEIERQLNESPEVIGGGPPPPDSAENPF